MPHFKRRRPKNRRAGCLMRKPWKVNGFGKRRPGSERFSDHRRRRGAELDLAEELAELLAEQRQLSAARR